MFKEFKEFAMRGNVLDLAIGVIIGAAFGKIVTSFTQDILTPPIGMLTGDKPFSHLAIRLGSGGATINYGNFLNAVLDFLIVAFALFLLVRAINRMQRHPEKAVDTRECPFCLSVIPIKATRCPQCTSEVGSASATPVTSPQ